MSRITVADFRRWSGIGMSTLTDADMQRVIDAEEAQQDVRCPGAPTDSEDLIQALYRRASRHVAARNVPLGLVGADAEFGGVRLGAADAEIERLEAPYRPPVVA